MATLRSRLGRLEQSSRSGAGNCHRRGLPVRQLRVIELQPGQVEPPDEGEGDADRCRCGIGRIIVHIPADRPEEADA